MHHGTSPTKSSILGVVSRDWNRNLTDSLNHKCLGIGVTMLVATTLSEAILLVKEKG